VFALCLAFGLFTISAVLAAYAIHKTKASRVRFTVEFWKTFRFNFSADSPSGPEGPDPDDEP
jgi:hypothetical protein